MTDHSPEFDPWPSVEELLEIDEPEKTSRLEHITRILAGMNLDLEIDPRDHVFEASTRLAQVTIGRDKTDDESWDDIVQLIEEDGRSSLASALWVGLSDQPEARYPSLDLWKRSMMAGLRSDAATAEMIEQESSAGGPRLLMFVALVTLLGAIGLGGWYLSGDTAPDSTDTTGVAAPSTEPTSAEQIDDGGQDADVQDGDVQDGANQDSDVQDGANQDSEDDPAEVDVCSVVGSLGQLFVDQTTDRAITIGWEPSLDAVNILLDGGFVDTVPADTNQYVIEHRPLLPPPLPSGTGFLIEIATNDDSPSSACATTGTEPGSQNPIGVYAPTGLQIIDQTPTSVTIVWDLRPGADTHNLFLDGRYQTYGDGLGSTSVGDETEFVLFDLEPGTTFEIGIRRIEGFNQSGMAVVTATTPRQ